MIQKNKIDKNKIRFYLVLTVIWFLIWEISNIVNHPEEIFQWTINELWRCAYILIHNIILLEYTVPFLTRKRKYIIPWVLVILLFIWIHMLFLSFGLYAWRHLGIALHIYTPFMEYIKTSEGVEHQMGFAVASVLFFGVIKHIYDYRKLKKTAQQLQIEKQAAELNYLKSQTNPHFLFNTLNNIYSLARDKSDLAPESIMRLSKILRFMLYETGGEYISIEQEMKIIDDYIALEKLRYDESLRINFNNDIEDRRQALPPLLLIPLVENAFKHGVSETRGQPFVDIHLSVKGRQLTFVVKNSSEKIPGEERVKENIGLSNLRRQLELLYKDYDLSVQQGASLFTATLKINLSSHV